MYIRVHSWATSLQANSLLYGTTDVLVAVEQCTSVYTVQQRVCGANSLLLNFTDIPVRSEDARSVQKTPAGVLVVRRAFIAVAAFTVHPFRKPFEIDDVDTRNTAKKYRRRIYDTLRTLFYRMTQ